MTARKKFGLYALVLCFSFSLQAQSAEELSYISVNLDTLATLLNNIKLTNEQLLSENERQESLLGGQKTLITGLLSTQNDLANQYTSLVQDYRNSVEQSKKLSESLANSERKLKVYRVVLPITAAAALGGIISCLVVSLVP